MSATPKRPPVQGCESDSRLESLPQQSHFNYTTPNRSHAATPPTEHLRLHSMGDGKGIMKPCPHTPPAPRKGRRLRSRLNFSDQALSYEDELCKAVDRNKLN